MRYENGDIDFITKKAFTMVYDAEVRAGVDLAQARVEVSGNAITVSLPAPQLLGIEIDPNSLEFYDSSFALFNWENKQDTAEALKVASTAAGRTGLVCAGGSTVDAETFLTQLYDQIHTGGAVGNATGRNIHQRSLDEAVRLTKAISAITLADYSVEDALDVFNGDEDFKL